MNKETADDFLRCNFFTSKTENDEYIDDCSRSKFSTLNKDAENESLRSKISTSKKETRGGRKYAPYAFTEQGVYMLMTVLKGELAVAQSKLLVRLFKQMKDCIVENQQVVSQRDFLRLTLQTADNAQRIFEVQHQLTVIDDKVENVVSNLGDMVGKWQP